MRFGLQHRSRFKITTHFSDITFEDLKNQELIEELCNRGLIEKKDLNALAEFSKGIELKKG